jgi:phosphoenolpyruvate carboxylase
VRFAICASAREGLCGALVMSPESPGMMQTKTRDEIDFDWAYVQLLCLEQDAVADMVRELYPELEGSQDFLDEFNLVQDHRQLQTLAGLAADIEAAISTSGDGVNLDRKIATAEKMLTAYLRGKLQKIKTLLEEVSKDDQSES